MTITLRMLLATTPWFMSLPGIMATLSLAAPACGLILAEYPELYPDAYRFLWDFGTFSAIVFLIWTIVVARTKVLRSEPWRRVTGRLAIVGLACAGSALGLTASLILYAAVNGVEDMCDPVTFILVPLFGLLALFPLFLLYVLIEATVQVVGTVRDVKRSRAAPPALPATRAHPYRMHPHQEPPH